MGFSLRVSGCYWRAWGGGGVGLVGFARWGGGGRWGGWGGEKGGNSRFGRGVVTGIGNRVGGWES